MDNRPEQLPRSEDHNPISLWMVLARLWDVVCRRHKLHDNEPYGWAWKDLTSRVGSEPFKSNFLGGSIDLDGPD